MTQVEYQAFQKRNQKICEDYAQIKSYRTVAQMHGLSRNRIQEIVTKAERDKQYELIHKEEIELKNRIYELPLSSTGATRLYNALRRYGIKSLAELQGHYAYELVRKHNIGTAMIDAMLEYGLIPE